jgi:hypothetical protein
MVVVTSRPFKVSATAAYTQIKLLPAVRVIELKSLDSETMEKILSENLGVQKLPPKLLDAIQKKAQGIPFLGVQLANHLKEQHTFKILLGRIILAADVELSNVVLPDSIQGVVVSRIDR